MGTTTEAREACEAVAVPDHRLSAAEGASEPRSRSWRSKAQGKRRDAKDWRHRSRWLHIYPWTKPAERAKAMAPLHKAAELSPDLIKRLRKVEQKHRDQERRDELEFIENGPHYIGFDRDAAIEEFKRKWVR